MRIDTPMKYKAKVERRKRVRGRRQLRELENNYRTQVAKRIGEGLKPNHKARAGNIQDCFKKSTKANDAAV